MRRLLILAVVLAGLAGCQMSRPEARPAGPAITESVLPDPAAGAEGEAEAAPEPLPEAAPEPVAAPAPLPPPDPPMLVQQRAACQRGGGQLMARGSGLFSCVQPTRDSGRSCNAARDCEGLCLARSATCAPFRPIFGCQEVFTAPGRRETLCTD